MQGKKVYFLSDAHLGAKLLKDNREREIMLVEFLQSIKPDCLELYLLGDMFDFWFEYKHVVPKGHVRFLAELANFTDQGIKVHFFTGNHDIWAFDYLAKECGVILHTSMMETTINGKSFLIGHGDGLNQTTKGIFSCVTLSIIASYKDVSGLSIPTGGSLWPINGHPIPD